MDTPIRTLTCCCCGESTKGRQWFNRDAGFGICAKCIAWLRSRSTSEKEISDLYGVEGIHFNVVGTFRNKNFTARNYECTNIVACQADAPPNENWVEADDSGAHRPDSALD